MRWLSDQTLGKRKTIKMCGRITLRRPDRVKIERLNTRALFESLPRYNIAPSHESLGSHGGKRRTLIIFAPMGLDSIVEQEASRIHQCASRDTQNKAEF
jgi:hypothetical protein